MLTTLLWSGELAKGQIAVQEALKKPCFRTQSFITGGPRKNIPQAARCWNWVAMKESSVLAAWGKYSWIGDQRKQLVRHMGPIFASTWFFIIFFFFKLGPMKDSGLHSRPWATVNLCLVPLWNGACFFLPSFTSLSAQAVCWGSGHRKEGRVQRSLGMWMAFTLSAEQ